MSRPPATPAQPAIMCGVDTHELVEHLEQIARDPAVAPSARVRALETLLRINRSTSDEDLQWQQLVADLGGDSDG